MIWTQESIRISRPLITKQRESRYCVQTEEDNAHGCIRNGSLHDAIGSNQMNVSESEEVDEEYTSWSESTRTYASLLIGLLQKGGGKGGVGVGV